MEMCTYIKKKIINKKNRTKSWVFDDWCRKKAPKYWHTSRYRPHTQLSYIMVYAVHSSVVAVWSITSVFLEQYSSLSFSRVSQSSLLVIHLLFLYTKTFKWRATIIIHKPCIIYVLYNVVVVLVVVHAIVIVDKNCVVYLRRQGAPHHQLDSGRVSFVPRRLRSHRWQGKRNFRLGLCARGRVNNDESVLLCVWNR